MPVCARVCACVCVCLCARVAARDQGCVAQGIIIPAFPLCADDEEHIQKPLLRLRGVGGAVTVAVCNTKGEARRGKETDQGFKYRGADGVGDWKLLADGAYVRGGS